MLVFLAPKDSICNLKEECKAPNFYIRGTGSCVSWLCKSDARRSLNPATGECDMVNILNLFLKIDVVVHV